MNHNILILTHTLKLSKIERRRILTNFFFILGIILALAGGLANNSGALLQKFAINKIPKHERGKGFYKKLFKSPYWVTGLILIMGASGALLMLAQMYIGGALIPGLASVGMVALVIGAVKILKEKIRLSEYIGIFLLIVSIVMIGISALDITDEDMVNFSETNFLIRFGIFTVVYLILWITSRQIGKRVVKGKTLFLALGATFPFVVSNAWLQPFIFLFKEMIAGHFTALNIILFIISIIIVAIINIIGIAHVQDAFKYGDASKIYPIGQIPTQTAPIILYYGIYLKNSPLNYSIYMIIFGVIIILISGFLLGRIQGQIETMDIDEEKKEITNAKLSQN